MLVRAAATFRLDWAEGSVSKTDHQHRWWIGAGCWLKVSVPHHVNLFIGLLEGASNMVAGFLQNEWSKREQDEAKEQEEVLYAESKVMHHHFYNILLVTQVFLFNVGESHHMNTRRGDHLRPSTIVCLLVPNKSCASHMWILWLPLKVPKVQNLVM